MGCQNVVDFMALKEQLLSTLLKKEELSPIQRFRFESLLSDKFGRDGLRIYFLINGTNTVQHIIEQTGIDEHKMLEMLRFASDNSVIRLAPTLLEEELAPKAAIAPEVARAKAGILPTLRSSAEKKIYDRFGQLGIDVYRLLDQVATPSEIPSRLPIAEPELLEILEFLQKENIIELEKPEEEKTEEAPPGEEAPTPSKELGKEAPPAPTEKEVVLPPRPILLPIKRSLGLFGKLKIEAELLRRFGQPGAHLFSLIDGERTTIKLAKISKYPLELIDRILDLLLENGAIDLHELTGEEIKERYGEEGLAICDVYGRDGVLIYELIDKRATIKEIIVASRVPPKRGVEIFAFIHKILGLEIPLDVHILYRQLGIET